MIRSILLTILLIFIACSSIKDIKKDIQSIDDEIIVAVMDELQKTLEDVAREAEKKAIMEAVALDSFPRENSNKLVRKSVERLDPIIRKALEKIEPAVKEAVKEIKDQVREEILEEMTGKEINQAIK